MPRPKNTLNSTKTEVKKKPISAEPKPVVIPTEVIEEVKQDETPILTDAITETVEPIETVEETVKLVEKKEEKPIITDAPISKPIERGYTKLGGGFRP